MKRALLILAIVLALAGLAWLLWRKREVILSGVGMYPTVPEGAPQPGQVSPASSSSGSNFLSADVFANKTGTKAVCAAVATVYTSGAAIPACGTVANIAHKVTQVQIDATKKVAGYAVSGAKKVGSAVGSVVSSIF